MLKFRSLILVRQFTNSSVLPKFEPKIPFFSRKLVHTTAIFQEQEEQVENGKMQNHQQNLDSILPYLPLQRQSGSLVWQGRVNETLKSLSKGPSHSRVDSGEGFSNTILDLREALSLPRSHMATSAVGGYKCYFDKVLSKTESANWFGEVVPKMAKLLLQFPSLLESHYENADKILVGTDTGLRLLEQYEPGIVFLSKELVATLLSCSFFCLYPSAKRKAKELPTINFDHLFALLSKDPPEDFVKNKIKCITHYFERICACKPSGYVSFERRLLPLKPIPPLITYPTSDLWANSVVPLCQFKVFTTGGIEDQCGGNLEIDFADKSFGGLIMQKGCVQEEIRFLINPELITGLLFLPNMAENEAIEIVGVQRFSKYTGYSKTFKFSGDYVDGRGVDSLGRRKTRIVAIDALPRAGTRQFKEEFLLREVNKAYCGFLGSRYQPPTGSEDRDAGVITGNWGCGIFGGDPEIKSMIQWVAASQASRPFLSYYTFRHKKMENLDQVCEWIVSQKWNVGDLWNRLADYCSKRSNGKTKLGFFAWVRK